jgi:hypothetical protein
LKIVRLRDMQAVWKRQICFSDKQMDAFWPPSLNLHPDSSVPVDQF